MKNCAGIAFHKNQAWTAAPCCCGKCASFYQQSNREKLQAIDEPVSTGKTISLLPFSVSFTAKPASLIEAEIVLFSFCK
jgi:hypothetical protein